jgi:hypothetical protein
MGALLGKRPERYGHCFQGKKATQALRWRSVAYMSPWGWTIMVGVDHYVSGAFERSDRVQRELGWPVQPVSEFTPRRP